MKKVALIDDSADTGYVISAVYIPDEGKSLPFMEFYKEASELGDKLYPAYVNFTKPVIGSDLKFPTEAYDFFSADISLPKEAAAIISKNTERFYQALQNLGYLVITGYKSNEKIGLEEIRNRLKEKN